MESSERARAPVPGADLPPGTGPREWEPEVAALRQEIASLKAQRLQELARRQLLQLRIDELGTALREKQEDILDMVVRLQNREEQAVRRSEERFRLLVESVKDYAIFMLDPQGRIVSWNEGAERIIGYAEQEVLGRHVNLLYPPEAVARGKAADDLREAAERGRFEEETWRIHRGGTPFWASAVLTALHAEDGRLLGYAKITRDLTERRRAEEALRRTAADLERSNLELEQFAYVASHDLQEPLRKITAFGDRLSKRYAPVLEEQGRDYVERMRSAAARMQTLIEDVLTFSRVTRQAQEFTPINLTVLAQEVVSDLESRLTATGGRVELAPLPTVEVDPGQLRRLLQNLIGNALKFHRPDAPPVVRVHAQVEAGPAWAPERGHCRIFVEDNGIGFEEQYLDRIFIIFQRLHGRSEFEGTGMGLAICRKIVERHGGSITASSAPGQGSTFVVTLPLVHPREEVNHGADRQSDSDPHRG